MAYTGGSEDEDKDDNDITTENNKVNKEDDKDRDMDNECNSKNEYRNDGDDKDIDSSKFDWLGIDKIIEEEFEDVLRNLIVDDVEDSYW